MTIRSDRSYQGAAKARAFVPGQHLYRYGPAGSDVPGSTPAYLPISPVVVPLAPGSTPAPNLTRGTQVSFFLPSSKHTHSVRTHCPLSHLSLCLCACASVCVSISMYRPMYRRRGRHSVKSWKHKTLFILKFLVLHLLRLSRH